MQPEGVILVLDPIRRPDRARMVRGSCAASAQLARSVRISDISGNVRAPSTACSPSFVSQTGSVPPGGNCWHLIADSKCFERLYRRSSRWKTEPSFLTKRTFCPHQHVPGVIRLRQKLLPVADGFEVHRHCVCVLAIEISQGQPSRRVVLPETRFSPAEEVVMRLPCGIVHRLPEAAVQDEVAKPVTLFLAHRRHVRDRRCGEDREARSDVLVQELVREGHSSKVVRPRSGRLGLSGPCAELLRTPPHRPQHRPGRWRSMDVTASVGQHPRSIIRRAGHHQPGTYGSHGGSLASWSSGCQSVASRFAWV